VSFSLEFLERSAADTGFRISALEKVVRLGELAADIRRHPFLGRVLILKGGSALNLCFGRPMRLSVDLDFNYIGQAERERMLEERPFVETALAELAGKKKYRVQKSAEAFAGRKYYLGYRSVLGPEERIEVDLNFVFRVPFSGVESREVWQPGELERPVVPVVGLEELFIGKLLALLERGAGRDVWDAAHLPEKAGGLLETERFRKFFIALSIVLERPLQSYSRERLERLVPERILTEQVAPLLSVQLDFKEGNLVERAWRVVAGFLDLRAEERTFLKDVSRGVLNLAILFPESGQEADRIAAHPAIQWKMANVQAYLAIKRQKE
jgi:hypothetical protein